jgi:YCII-related domain
MTNYVLTYKGGGMPQTEAEQQATMAAWGSWFESLGSAVVDGGNPFGPSMSVASDGTTSEGAASGLTGYTIVSAESLAEATDLAKGCPVLSSGGGVEVYETFRVM